MSLEVSGRTVAVAGLALCGAAVTFKVFCSWNLHPSVKPSAVVAAYDEDRFLLTAQNGTSIPPAGKYAEELSDKYKVCRSGPHTTMLHFVMLCQAKRGYEVPVVEPLADAWTYVQPSAGSLQRSQDISYLPLYCWADSPEELEIGVLIGEGIKRRDVTVSVQKNWLHMEIKEKEGRKVLLDDKLPHSVIPEESS